MRQGPKGVVEYVEEASTLYQKWRDNFRDLFGKLFVAGLADENKFHMVQLYLSANPKNICSFPAAKAAVIKAYTRIVRASPFDLARHNAR